MKLSFAWLLAMLVSASRVVSSVNSNAVISKAAEETQLPLLPVAAQEAEVPIVVLGPLARRGTLSAIQSKLPSANRRLHQACCMVRVLLMWAFVLVAISVGATVLLGAAAILTATPQAPY